jgi:hypothetical protein
MIALEAELRAPEMPAEVGCSIISFCEGTTVAVPLEAAMSVP